MREAIVEKIVEIADRVGRSEDIEIVEVQLLGGGKSRVLRIFIDKEGGVTHADCENISHQVGTILDIEDVIPGGEYTLEVSSPGVDRKLTKPKDFQRFTGKRVKVIFREPMENARHWEGKLAAFENNVLTIDNGKGKVLQVPLENIEKANLKFEW